MLTLIVDDNIDFSKYLKKFVIRNNAKIICVTTEQVIDEVVTSLINIFLETDDNIEILLNVNIRIKNYYRAQYTGIILLEYIRAILELNYKQLESIVLYSFNSFNSLLSFPKGISALSDKCSFVHLPSNFNNKLYPSRIKSTETIAKKLCNKEFHSQFLVPGHSLSEILLKFRIWSFIDLFNTNFELLNSKNFNLLIDKIRVANRGILNSFLNRIRPFAILESKYLDRDSKLITEQAKEIILFFNLILYGTPIIEEFKKKIKLFQISFNKFQKLVNQYENQIKN